MLVFVILTSLITFLVFILIGAAYLLSVIIDDSDDDPMTSTLALDTQDFSRTPVISPADNLNGNVANREESSRSGGRCSCVKAAESDKQQQQHQDKSQAQPEQKSAAKKTIKTSVQSDDLGPIDADPQLLQGAALLAGAASVIAQPEEIQSAEMNSRLLKACESQREPAEPATKPSSSQAEDQAFSAGVSSWHSSASAQKSIISGQLGSSVSKQIFEDFDPTEMKLGGTALHWCKTRRSLDRLLKLGLPLDIVNQRHETALHVAVRAHKLQVMIGLLNRGANLESRNEHGETPLILACKVNDIFAAQMLLIYDADFDATDDLNQSARHHSASICDKHKLKKQLPSAAHLILAMLNEIGAKRCPENADRARCDGPETKARIRVTCTDGCSHSGRYDGNSYSRWLTFDRESFYKRCIFEDILDAKKREFRNANNQARRGSRMLCMDGGGLRGVIVCQIMIEIEKYLKKPILSYFDWVGGTSVGAFIACAICLGTSLREMRRVCFEFKDEVFSGGRPYNSKVLERALKRTCGVRTRLSDVKKMKLAFATVLADREPCQLKIFRNYKSDTQMLEAYGFSSDYYNNMSSQTTLTTSGRRNTARRISNIEKATKTEPKSNEATALRQVTMKKSLDSSVLAKPEVEQSIGAEQKEQDSRTGNKGSESRSIKQSDQTTRKEAVGKKESETSLSKEQPEAVLDENEHDPMVWQAVRASAAAPFFFKPYGPYLDGGIISNNPTLDMLTEFTNYHKVRQFIKRHSEQISNPLDDADLDRLSDSSPDKLDLVVSLGTGRGRVIGRQAMVDFGQIASGLSAVFSPVELVRSIRAARDLFKRLMQQSCHTDDHILDRAQAWCSSLEVPYFRLNPPLATIFSIDDKRDEQLINALWQTKLYMLSMKDQLIELAELLENGCCALKGENNKSESDS